MKKKVIHLFFLICMILVLVACEPNGEEQVLDEDALSFIEAVEAFGAISLDKKDDLEQLKQIYLSFNEETKGMITDAYQTLITLDHAYFELLIETVVEVKLEDKPILDSMLTYYQTKLLNKEGAESLKT